MHMMRFIKVQLKQYRQMPKLLAKYQQHAATLDDAILNTYRSGGYTKKRLVNFFGIHYSLVSRIITKKSKP